MNNLAGKKSHSDKAPSVSVIILNWNGLQDTVECLQSVKKINYPNFDIMVADNGSTDASVAVIQSNFPEVKLLINGDNLGFAEGNNRAIRQALDSEADFILLLNNDTIVDSEILSELIQAAETMPKGGVFGPKIYHFEQQDVIWYAGGYWDPDKLSFEEVGAGVQDQGQFNTLMETEWVIGCAMFIRSQVFRKIGLLEPQYFLNNEEIDFCSRSKRAGYSCVFVPKAKLWHKISVSFGGENSPMKEYFITRNRLLWARRNAEYRLRLRIYFKALGTMSRRFLRPLIELRGLTSRSFKQWWWHINEVYRDPINRSYMLGIRDFLLGRFGNCPDKVRDITNEWLSKK